MISVFKQIYLEKRQTNGNKPTCLLLCGRRASRTPDMSNSRTCRLSWGRAMILWFTDTLILENSDSDSTEINGVVAVNIRRSSNETFWNLCPLLQVQVPSSDLQYINKYDITSQTCWQRRLCGWLLWATSCSSGPTLWRFDRRSRTLRCRRPWTRLTSPCWRAEDRWDWKLHSVPKRFFILWVTFGWTGNQK